MRRSAKVSTTSNTAVQNTAARAGWNRLSGYAYDANGNLISTGYTYDVENRMSFASAGAVQYFYDAQNKRVWQANATTRAKAELLAALTAQALEEL